MNPLSINPLMLLGAGAMALALGFGSGWMTNGWRLDGAHQRALTAERVKYDELNDKVREQNHAVDTMRVKSEGAAERGKLAEKFAAGAIARASSRGAAAAASKATDCDGVLRENWEGWK